MLTFEDYSQAHLVSGQAIWLQLILTCPLSCSHCSVYSSPKRTEALDRKYLELALKSFSRRANARIACFTGGEPFLSDDLPFGLSLASNLGMETYVVTGAHWSTTPEEANKTLAACSPISLMTISADSYHEPWVPIGNVVCAVEAALGHDVTVNIATIGSPEQEDYKQRLQVALSGVLDHVTFFDTPLHNIGRSKNSSFVRDDSVLDLPCNLLGTCVVTVDGSVCACCQPRETNVISQSRVYTDHALRLGHLSEGEYAVAGGLQKLTHDPLLRAIAVLGPKWVCERAAKSGLPLESVAGAKTICDICAGLVRSPEISNRLRAILSLPEVELSLSYMESQKR